MCHKAFDDLESEICAEDIQFFASRSFPRLETRTATNRKLMVSGLARLIIKHLSELSANVCQGLHRPEPINEINKINGPWKSA